jgi:hypothetical protein
MPTPVNNTIHATLEITGISEGTGFPNARANATEGVSSLAPGKGCRWIGDSAARNIFQCHRTPDRGIIRRLREAANTSERFQQLSRSTAGSLASSDVRRLASGLTDEIVSNLTPRLPKLDMAGYPGLRGYSWEQCHEGFKGAGGLFWRPK